MSPPTPTTSVLPLLSHATTTASSLSTSVWPLPQPRHHIK
jgi:hypothetical protein